MCGCVGVGGCDDMLLFFPYFFDLIQKYIWRMVGWEGREMKREKGRDERRDEPEMR